MAASRFRSTYLLTGFFIVLLLIVVFYENGGNDKARKTAQYDKPLLTQDQIQNIDSITLASDGTETILTDQPDDEDVFRIDGVGIVDRDEQDGLLEEIMGLSYGKVVSRNSANWEKYGLVEETQKMLSVSTSGTELLKMYFGNGGNTYKSMYARLDGEDKVREVTTQLSRFFSYQPETWKNKHLVMFEKDEIEGVDVKLGEESYTLSKSETGAWTWDAESGAVPVSDMEAMDAYLDGLVALKATGFAEEDVTVEAGEHVLTLSLSDGMRSVVTIVSGSEENQYLATVSGVEEVFTVGSDLRVPLKPSFVEDLKELDDLDDLEDVVEEEGDSDADLEIDTGDSLEE